jgi:hypothetical protein
MAEQVLPESEVDREKREGVGGRVENDPNKCMYI